MLDWEGKEHECNFNKYEHACKHKPTIRVGLYVLVLLCLFKSCANGCRQQQMVEQLDRIEMLR